MVNALVGAVGVEPTVAAIESGKDIALANKETLVVAGEKVMSLVQQKGVSLRPIDSEHSALQQCLRAGRKSEIKKLWLTCSGGPFVDAENTSVIQGSFLYTLFLAILLPSLTPGRVNHH